MENNNNFDFEKWSRLANTDPEAFEQHRSQVINNFIQDLPEERQQRIRCLQWRVDGIRRTSKTPMAACIEISRMMWDSVKGESGLLSALYHLQSVTGYSSVENDDDFNINFPTKSATILTFPKLDLIN